MGKNMSQYTGWLLGLLLAAITGCSQLDWEQEGLAPSGDDHITRADEVTAATVTSDEEGSLYALGTDGKALYAGVQKLTLKGKFNENDIKYVRDSLDVTILDLSDAVFPFTEITSSLFNIPRRGNRYTDGKFTDITLPKEGITSIGNSAFYNCYSLTSITLPDGITSIGESAFYYCSSLTSITLPNGLTSIGSYAFCYCSSLKSITLPDGLTSIGSYAFYKCYSLTSIALPDGITSIGESAFYYCSSLTSITLPSSLTNIYSSTFSGCSKLKEVVSHSQSDIWDLCSTDNLYCWLLLDSKDGRVPLYGANWKNVAIDGVAESVILPYQYTYSFNIPKTVKQIKKISYTMQFNDNAQTWHTLALPFKPTQIISKNKGLLAPFDSNVEGAKPFWLCELTEEGFMDATSIEANRAYLIAVPSTSDYMQEYIIKGDVTFSAENLEWGENADDTPIPSYGTDYTMYPTWEPVSRSEDVYAIYNLTFRTDNYTMIYPFEAYIKSTSMRSIIAINAFRTAGYKANTRSVNRIPQKGDM